MTAYVNYEYYKDSFLGSAVRAADFPRLALRASIYIKAVTHGKATAEHEAVKDAACAVAEVMAQLEAEDSGTVKASEAVADWSVSYVKPQSVNTDEKTRLINVIEPYFYGTGLLYAGINYPTIEDILEGIK